MYDLVIIGGTIIDGTGRPPYRSNLGITNRKIAHIQEGALVGKRTVDASGKLVVPGFIDLHGHSEFTLLVDPRGASKLLQGVTTEIVGNCGGWVAPLTGYAEERAKQRAQDYGADQLVNWDTVDEYLRTLQSSKPALNVGALVGHGNLRAVTMGSDDRIATRRDRETMSAWLEAALDQGAWGMSAGLYYAPGVYANHEEMSTLCRVIAKHGGLYSCHMRDEAGKVEESVSNLVTMAEHTGARSQIAHIKAFGTQAWNKAPLLIELVDGARQRGADVAADQYPYRASDTRLSGSLLSLSRWAERGGRKKFLERLGDERLRRRIQEEVEASIEVRGGADQILLSDYPPRPSWAGQYLADLAEEHAIAPAELTLQMLEEGDGRVICFSMLEEDVRRFMVTPWVAIASDGRALAIDGPLRRGHPHPRSFGTFPRVLAHYVRETGLLDWAEAIRKMTSLPAERLGLNDRGRLITGLWADVVVFDPQQVVDTSTFLKPFAYPCGIEQVFVNGSHAVENGRLTDCRSGMVLRKPG